MCDIHYQVLILLNLKSHFDLEHKMFLVPFSDLQEAYSISPRSNIFVLSKTITKLVKSVLFMIMFFQVIFISTSWHEGLRQKDLKRIAMDL